MLSPDSRAVAFELFRPPSGYRLDFAVLTTYTLDLEALLVLPLSMLAHADGGLEELLADPLRLHQAIRDAGDRVHVFVDETGIGVPRSARRLYSMLESSVHAVRAPSRGAFHPKVWAARFAAKDETAEDLLRVAILSRNLTFDRSWDVALASEAPPGSGRRVSAFGGSNVEVMASVTGRKGRSGGATGCGIDRFLESGFQKLRVPYQRVEPEIEDQRVTAARERLEAARDALLAADLRMTCIPGDDLWTLTIYGSVAPPADDVEVVAWPVSVAEDQALRLAEPLRWRLPVARLTAFVAFRLRVAVQGVDDIRMTLRLPAEGMPADRLHHMLKDLLDSPEKFLRFLRALLGGLDELTAWAANEGEGDGSGTWGVGLGGETLLDDLVRTASRDPDRLKPVRRLIDDLRKTEEGRRIVPDELLAVWTAVEEAVAREPRS